MRALCLLLSTPANYVISDSLEHGVELVIRKYNQIKMEEAQDVLKKELEQRRRKQEKEQEENKKELLAQRKLQEEKKHLEEQPPKQDEKEEKRKVEKDRSNDLPTLSVLLFK